MKFKINDNIINEDGRTARISFSNDDFCVFMYESGEASTNYSQKEMEIKGWSVVQKKPEPFVPEDDETYYHPDVSICRYGIESNTSEAFDEFCINSKIAFKTKEEAIACAEFMLEAWKNREK